jgi:hypothetical protein
MLKLLRPLAACLVLMLTPAAPASAQSPDGIAAAKELLTVMHAVDNFKAMMPHLVQAIRPVVAQGRPDVERDFDAIVPTLLSAR